MPYRRAFLAMVLMFLVALLLLLALPVPIGGVAAQPLPAVSIAVPADDPTCVSAPKCMDVIYRAMEQELRRRYPQCGAVWGYQYPFHEQQRVAVVVTVRCIQFLVGEL
ncbi:MAG: hypothetical protein HY473_01840 [Candidatus Sungbacteria bacterium]|uniref:Uncharacterized protein n=1 Tax=Candidatus Sungiibacteriota bacterium TaxID=2750080 RepID=A0A932YXC7_9BACT|nr:hypothetical protein [Candidatus Sungbacteria bacterium]